MKKVMVLETSGWRAAYSDYEEPEVLVLVPVVMWVLSDLGLLAYVASDNDNLEPASQRPRSFMKDFLGLVEPGDDGSAYRDRLVANAKADEYQRRSAKQHEATLWLRAFVRDNCIKNVIPEDMDGRAFLYFVEQRGSCDEFKKLVEELTTEQVLAWWTGQAMGRR